MRGLTIHTAAKINLCLRVLARRPDGYHNVETILHAVGLWDEVRLTLEGAPGEVALAVHGEPAPCDESNLCWRAARALGSTLRSPPGVGISLSKVIPVGAGLGGGSSDAAATLLGLCRLWSVDPSPAELTAVAAGLGTDVPFFLAGGCSLATGRGDRLEGLPAATLSLVIVVPERRIATTQAYTALGRGASLGKRRALTRATQRGLRAVRSGDAGAIASVLHNDFEGLDMVGIAEAREAKLALLEAGCLGALLSGSGSAVFGVAPDRAAAEAAAARLRARWSWVRVTSTVGPSDSLSISERREEPALPGGAAPGAR